MNRYWEKYALEGYRFIGKINIYDWWRRKLRKKKIGRILQERLVNDWERGWMNENLARKSEQESLCQINKISCDLKGGQVSWNECD